METEALPDATAVEQATQQQQQQETHSMDQETILTAHTQKHDHSSPTDEDYGPLKKKHKYRDDRERDKEGRATTIAGGDQGGNPAELDGSVELHDPSSAAPAVSVEPSYNIEQQQQPEQARDQSPRTEERPTAAQAAPEEQQQEAQQSRNEEHSKSKDLASSPSSNTEKARKHNFYVPSREVAFLLDSFPTTVESSGDASSSSSSLQNQNMTSGTGDASGAGSDTTDPAQAQANALLASGMPISSRQAAKIAAMEAKEKARLEKEKELEELKLKRKAEAERKKAEAARKKAEKEAGIAANTASVQSTKRKDSTASNMSAQQAGAAAAAAVPAKAPSKPKRAPTAASKRGNTKSNTSTTTKQASPELPVYENLFQNSLPSPDIKITSPPQQHLSHAPQAGQSSIPVPPSSTAQIILPPMPEPQVDPMSGFIPYASEGARAAALAKAAKQKANGAAGSPPSGSGNSTLPLPGTSANTKNNRGGKKNQVQGSPLGVQQLLGAAAATASTSGTGNKKGKQSSSSSNSALNGNGTAAKGKAQALAAAANAANSYSGRASPTNALEHAAAAIDAVLDAGALARAQAQAQAEEEEEDDRLYCICQQLYDPERLMIACDRCDNWFHADCINIDEDSITLIDLFICPVCEKDSDLRTVSKPRCAREGCTEAAVKLSKYCSDRCGILVASSKLDLDKLDHDSASLDLLWDAVSSVKKLETVVKVVDDDNDKDGKISLIQDGSGPSTDIANGNNVSSIIPKFDLQARIEEEQERLEKLQNTLAEYVTKRQKLDDSLALMNARLAYCKYAEKRWRMTCRQHISQSKASGTSSSSSNKKSKSSAASASRGDSDNFPIPPDAPCGFDVRLIWKDEDWQNWLDSDQGRKLINAAEEVCNAIEEGRDASQYILQNADQGERIGDGGNGGNEEEEDGDEGLICTLTKKKCDRHTGWPVLREADFKVEKLGLERQLESVTDSERRIRRRVEDIEDFLRRANEKVAADKRSHASTPGLNGDTVEKVEDEGADGNSDERNTSMMVDEIPPARNIALQA